MKQIKQERPQRVHERGAVAILLAFFLTTLFAFAAFSIDMGFRYTRFRMLQAVADASVSAGMPALVAGNSNTAGNNATNMARANGYSGGNVTIDTATAGQLKVTVMASAPSFFSALFGGGSSRLVARQEGRVSPYPWPGAAGAGRLRSPGLASSGNGKLTSMEISRANSNITISTGGGSQPQTTRSSVQSHCGAPTVWSSSIVYSGGGPRPPAAPFPDPFALDTTALPGNVLYERNVLVPASAAASGTWPRWRAKRDLFPPGGRLLLQFEHQPQRSRHGVHRQRCHADLLGASQRGRQRPTYGSSLTAAAGVPSNLAVYAGATAPAVPESHSGATG